MKRCAVLVLCIGSILGIAFGFVFHFGIFFVLFLASISFFISLLAYRWSSSPYVFVVALFFFAVVFGVFRTDSAVSSTDALQLKIFEGKTVTLHGIVKQESDQRDAYTNSILTVDVVSYANATTSLRTKVLVRGQMYPEITYGDELRVTGKLVPPKNFTTSDLSTKEFNYILYLAKDGIYETVSYPKIEIVSHNNGNWVIRTLLAGKQKFEKKLQSFLPEPHASLENGILLGTKQSLGKELLAEFQKAGVSHVVVLSGYNVAIVIEYLMKAVQFLPGVAMYVSGFFGLVLFVALVGAQATVVRAAIMASLALFAKAVGREYDALVALLIAAALMSIQNPYIVLYDPSFQLSFLATLGLILFSNLLQPYFLFVSEKFGLREILVTTISAQILVLPLILYDIGSTSLLSLPANILIVSIVPVTMFFGFVTGVFGFVFTPLGLACSAVSYALLSYILFVVHFIASVPLTQITVSLSLAALFFCYSIIAMAYAALRVRNTTMSQKATIHE